MKSVAVAVMALSILGVAGLAAVFGAGSAREVYSVADVRAGLARDPHAWAGQTVLIRADVIGSWFPVRWVSATASRPSAGRTGLVQLLISLPQPGGVLVDNSTQPPALGLPLAFAPEDQVLSFLRRLPWIGRFAPGPQRLSVDPGQPAVYRVRIQVAPAGSCVHRPCYEALLLDSAPQPIWLRAGHGLVPVTVMVHAAPVRVIGLTLLTRASHVIRGIRP